MKRPEINGWEVTTNENGIKMATLPRDTMEEILKYVEYADKQLRLHNVVWQSEQFYCTCSRAKGLDHDEEGMPYCIECQKPVQ